MLLLLKSLKKLQLPYIGFPDKLEGAMANPRLFEKYMIPNYHRYAGILHTQAKKRGIHNYSIFMHGRELYSYFEVEDLDRTMNLAAADPDNQRWQVHMADFFDTGPGIQDGTTVYPVEAFYSPGNQQSQSSLSRRAAIHRLRVDQSESFRLACDGAPPEVHTAIRKAGVQNDCIYLVGQTVFTYHQSRDPDASRALAAGPAYKAWQDRLVACLEPGISTPLEEVFYVE